MKRLVAIWAIVALIAMILTPDLRAQEAWNVDSARFERYVPDSLMRSYDVEQVVILPWGGMIAAIQGGHSGSGVWLKNSEGEWSHPYLPLPTGNMWGAYCAILTVDSSGNPLLLVGTDNGPYASSDSGFSWHAYNGLTVQQMNDGGNDPWFGVRNILAMGNGEFWVADESHGPAFTLDWGRTWQFLTAGLHQLDNNTGTLVVDHNGQIWLSGADAMYRLNRPDVRDGHTWEWIPLRDGIEYNLGEGMRACLPILATWPDGKCDDGSGLMFLWSGWGFIYRSEDSGQNWDQMTDLDEYTGVGNATVIPSMIVNQSGILFLGAESGGLSVSNDQGDNWQPVPTGRDQNWHDWIHGISDLGFDPDGYLVLGTSNGIVRSTIPMNGPLAEEEPDIVVPNPELPETIELLSVFPNPFNGVLRVNINAESNQPYSVSILDVTGRLVTVLSKGFGSAQLVWNASDNPSGLYWIQSVVDNKNLTKGVYLVR